MAQSNDDPFAAYQKPLVPDKKSKGGDDPFAAYQTPLAATSAPDLTKSLYKDVIVVGKNSAGQPILAPASDIPGYHGGAASRFLSSAVKALVDPFKGAYHGVIEGPQDSREAEIEAANPYAGRGDLILHRFLIDPTKAEANKTAAEFKQSDPWSLHPSQEAIWHRQLALGHGLATILPGIGPAVAQTGEQVGTQIGTGDVAGGLGTLGGNVAMYAAPEATGRLGKWSLGYAREKYGPATVELAGVKVPVSVGEAYPQGMPGRTHAMLKRSGVGSERFGAFEAAQQESAKDVIRKTAEQTSGYTPSVVSNPVRGSAHPFVPFVEEPAVTMKGAAQTTLNQAKTLYQTLDASAATVPSTFDAASKVTRQAIARAEKLGITVDMTGTTSVLEDANGQPVSASAINAADRLNGIRTGRYVNQRVGNTVEVLDAQMGQPVDPNAGVNAAIKAQTHRYVAKAPDDIPITTFIKVRSELLKIQRSTPDPALRYTIGNEVGAMDTAMENALGKNSALHQTWQTANSLWKKGRALERVGEAVRLSVKGTPQAAQAGGLVPVPTEIQGASLVKRLNKLAEGNTLKDAFTAPEIANLRESADILDRVQRVRVGKSEPRGARMLGRVAHGAIGPVGGAIVGSLFHGLGGAEAGAMLGAVLQNIPEQFLVRAMTKLDGVQALRAVQAAQTPIQLQVALNRLALAAGTGSAAQQSSRERLRQLQQEAARLNPSKPVKMRAPDGSIEEVPYDQVDHYKSEGATEVKSE